MMRKQHRRGNRRPGGDTAHLGYVQWNGDIAPLLEIGITFINHGLLTIQTPAGKLFANLGEYVTRNADGTYSVSATPPAPVVPSNVPAPNVTVFD